MLKNLLSPLIGTEKPLYSEDPEESSPSVQPAQRIKLLEAPTPKANPRESNIRWIILALGIMTNYGAYFCNDNPQPLQSHIEDIFKIQDAKFNMLYSMSILPNVLIPFLGGLAMDALGIRFTMVITVLLVIVGQGIITMGAHAYDFQMMVIGRFIYGCGNQTLENSLLIVISRWFLTKELTFAWGIARTFLRSATALNSALCPKLFIWTNQLYVPFLVGLCINIVSCICVFALVYLDSKAESETQDEAPTEFTERMSVNNLRPFPRLFYLILLIGVGTYTSFLGFTNNSNNLLVKRFGFTPESAGSVIMIIYIVAATLSPFIGIMIDRFGKRIFFIFTGIILLFITQTFFLFLDDGSKEDPNYNVIIGFIGFGIFYAIFSTSFWTSIPLIVSSHATGTAIGMTTSVSAISQSFFTELLGVIHDGSLSVHYGYFWTQVAHCVVLSIVLSFVFWAHFEDMRTNGRLHKVNKQNRMIVEEESISPLSL